MHTCRFSQSVERFIDGQLSGDARLDFEEHLKSCAACSGEVARLRQLSERLQSWHVPATGEGFLAAVRDKIVARELERGDEKMRHQTMRYLIPSGVIAGILVFLVVGVRQMNVRRMMQATVTTGEQPQPAQPPAQPVTPAIVPQGKTTLTPQQLQQLKSPLVQPVPQQPIMHSGMVAESASRSDAQWSFSESISVLGQSKEPMYLYGSISPGYYPPQSEFFEEEYARIYDNDFQVVKDNSLSTFSIDVDTASYSNLRRFLNGNQLPPADAVRIEELINYFAYDYPQPQGADPFSVTLEAAACPWNAEHELVLIGLQGKKMETKEMPPSNLVFLIDVSGSMQDYNKLPLLKQAFRLLVNQLRAEDKVSIVVYAGSTGVVLDSMTGEKHGEIMQAIDQLEAGGSTAGAEGITRAYALAKQNFIKEGNNRVILATDGDFNVGVTSESELIRLIEERRDEGIYLTIVGFGMGNYKDSKMEQMADKGNGSIAYIDNLLEGKKVFVAQLTGTLFTIAKDVKLQLEFNPAQVKAYRLVGYENRRLENKDFNDDKKDAGELGAGHTVTALYEIVPVGSKEAFGTTDDLKYQQTTVTPSDELLTVKLRYKKPNEDTSLLLTKVLKVNEEALSPSENFRFASSVAEFGMLLRDSKHKGSATYDSVLTRAKAAKGADTDGYRAEFIKLAEIAQMLSGSTK